MNKKQDDHKNPDDHTDQDLRAPHDTAYTRWSCHISLANPVPIVSTPPAPSNGADFRFLGKPALRTHIMAGNAPHKSGRCRD